MPKIFVLIDYYLPGHKFGGPIRTVSNVVSRLGSEFEFFVFTFDRDEGDLEPYSGVNLDQWVQCGKARVFYTRRKSVRGILGRLNQVSPDLVYLNSFFSRATVRVLMARRVGGVKTPVLLAPRGEFAEGALAIKSLRKRIYIALVNACGLLNGVTLQASSKYEQQQIEKHLSWARSHPPAIAPDLAEDPGKVASSAIRKQPGRLSVVFLSRISRNKNLDGALQILQGLQGEIDFSICGPATDPAYWRECEALLQQLPPNIHALYLGDVPHREVPQIFMNHHVLFLPSHGENFGHSIAESFAAGRPVIISDRTPWRNLDEHGVGADISLDQTDRFRDVLQGYVDMDEKEFAARSLSAREYILQHSSDKESVDQSRRLIEQAMQGRQSNE